MRAGSMSRGVWNPFGIYKTFKARLTHVRQSRLAHIRQSIDTLKTVEATYKAVTATYKTVKVRTAARAGSTPRGVPSR